MKSMAFKFEKLKVWEIALNLSARLSSVCKGFPKDELFILTAQLKRASDSVCLNIAEGSTGQTNAEQRLFLKYAMRSGIEVVACLFLAKKRGIISDGDFREIYADYEKLVRMLRSFMNKMDNRP
jgi:four helix bundle protein